MESTLTADLASLRIDRSGVQERSKRRFGSKTIAGVAVVAVACCAYPAAAPWVRARLFTTEVELTEIALVTPSQANTQLSASGYVVPQILSELVTKLPGRVAKSYVHEGDRVEVGQLLIELEAADQQVALQTARLRAVAAQTLVSVANANLSEIRLQAERQAGLATQGAVPAANAVDLNARVTTARQQVRSAEAEQAAAGASVRAAETTLASMTLVSPIRGIVLNKPPAVGDLVGGIGASSGLVQIADFDSLLVEAEVPEGRMRVVRAGAPCEIVLEAYPDRVLRGEALALMPRVNRAKASVIVKVRFLERADDVLPDMAARISFLDRAADKAEPAAASVKMVAASAVVRRGAEQVVFVLDGDKVRMAPVRLGAARGDRVELIRGPAAGTRLVNTPPAALHDGQLVRERASS